MRIASMPLQRRPRFAQLAGLCVFLLSSYGTLFTAAQDLDNVNMSGRVIDQNGALIPNATVTAQLDGTEVKRQVQSNGEGNFRFIELEPGIYNLTAESEGFQIRTIPLIKVLAGQNLQFDFTLYPRGASVDPVVVTADDLTPVDTTRTVVGGTVTQIEIEELPNLSRSPLDLIFTLGGVAEEPLSTRDLAEDRNTTNAATPEEAGAFSLTGGAAFSNNITIEGLDNNDDRAARERFQPSLEAVAEVQVITNQFSAEYGRASGGRINIRTRGGANRYRGRVFYFFRDEALNANSFRNNARGLSRLPLQEHVPGFTFSGPVILPRFSEGAPYLYRGENRTFFFTSYEYATILDTALIDTYVPVASNSAFPLPAPTNPNAAQLENPSASTSLTVLIAPFTDVVNTPVRRHTFSTRFDHAFGERHHGSALVQIGRENNLRQFGGGARLAETLLGRARNSEAISYTDSYTFSPNVVNQIRAQFSRLTPAVETSNGAGSPVVLISVRYPLDPTANRAQTLVAGTSTSGATDRSERRWQIQDALTVLHGAHTLKFGADTQRINSTFIDLSDASGTFDFASAGDFLAGRPDRFRQNFQTSSEQRNIYFGVFAQDDFRLRPNLILSFGVRYENESILNDRNNFAPRLALAYDPFGTGKTVMRAGAGIFYSRALLRTIDDFTLGSRQLFFDTNDLVDPVTRRALSDSQRRAFIAANLTFPNTLSVNSPLVRQFGALNTSFARRLDPNLRIPESYQFNLGGERELGAGFVTEINYTFNRGIHLWREFNANASRLPAGFNDFTDYLLSRDFVNFRPVPGGIRPLYDATTAGDLVRFRLSSFDAANPNAIGRVVESGVGVSLFNLNAPTSTTAVNVALAALNALRPDPSRTQIEQLISVGNSFYHGATFELRRRFRKLGDGGAGFSLRAAYTLSHLIDDGVVNTSSALRVGDFRGERARSLQDRRHRFVLSGVMDLPRRLGGLRFSPVLRAASGAPFNLSLGGDDRNLDDVGNDRPIFTGDGSRLRFRAPGEPLDSALLNAFASPSIGSTGNLPRNAGRGPGFVIFDLSVTREFRFGENSRLRLRPVLEADNVLNHTSYSFGAEFINFNALNSTATAEQRQAFADSFLVATRAYRPRQLRVGLRFDF